MRSDIEYHEETKKPVKTVVHLIEVHLACSIGRHSTEAACELVNGVWTEPIYITDFDRDLEYKGETFRAVNDLLGVSDISEASELDITPAEIILSGVDRSWIALMLQSVYIDKTVLIHQGFVLADGSLGPIVPRWKGFIDDVNVHDEPTETTTLVVSCKHHLADFDRVVGRLTNNASHQKFYPGDTCMSQADEGLKEIKWGKAS